MNKNELFTQLEKFDIIHEYVKGLLDHSHIDETGRSETMLVFEALYNDMIARGVPGDTRINRGGSILIGLLVIFNYMNAMDIIALAIYAEAIFGSLLSAANAAGDIVTIAIAEKYENHKA